MKFAYLIMAHHKFDILQLLLEDLDDERNDIYLHIDRKAEGFNEDLVRSVVHKSRLFIVDRIPVFWGDFSQIKCELHLLKAATDTIRYDYYHLLVGVEFPLKSQDEIHSFFEKNNGYEFIGYDYECDFIERIQYYYFLKKNVRCKNRTKWEDFFNDLGDYLLRKQKKIGINRIKHHGEEYRKGYANWSITHNLALYILEQKKEIYKRYKYTMCADEIFIHTIVYHSDFYENIYDKDDEYHSSMRLTTWDDPHNQLHMEDLPMLLKSDRLFARKFDDENAVEILKQLKEFR